MEKAIELSGRLGVEHNIDHSEGWSFPGADTEVVWENEQHRHFDLF